MSISDWSSDVCSSDLEACRTHDVKAAYLCPNQHNPTSLTMPEARRRELATLARRYEVAIIEADTFGQLDGSEPVPIAAHARELGFYIAGLSQTVSPGPPPRHIVEPEPPPPRVGPP